MPKVAFTPVIPSQPLEPPARAAASNEPSGKFGDILEASAGPNTPRADGAKRGRKADGAAQAKPSDDGSPPASTDAKDKDSGAAQVTAAAVPAATPSNQSDAASGGSAVATDAVTAVTTVDLAMLVQSIPTDPGIAASADLPNGKPEDTEKATAKADVTTPDKTADGCDDATASATPLDETAVAIAAPAIVAVATAIPTPSVAETNTGAASIDSAPLKGTQAAAATAVGSPSSTTQYNAASASVEGAPAKMQAQLTAASSVSTSPAAEDVAASADAGPPIKDALADPANAEAAPVQTATVSDEPVKPGEAKSAGLAQPMGKLLSHPDQQDQGLKAEGNKADGKKPEVSKAKDGPHLETKPAQSQASGDDTHAAGHAGEDSKMPAAHQAAGQPSEHARAAFAAAHSDISAPAPVAQAATAQLSNNPLAVGLNLAVPLTSPLQSVWQAAPQRDDASDSAVPVAGLAVEIVSRAQDGLRRFEIRLDPPELGRIDVRLDVDRGGTVTSRLTVERADTLDLLRRDAPQLERALQHAGLNTEGGGLQFSLRDQNFANREQSHQNAATFILTDDEPAAAEAARRGYGRLVGLGGGVDIRV